MKTRDFNSRSFKPQTVRHYCRAQALVFQCDGVFVPSKRYNQFAGLDRKLLHQGIQSNDYAFGVSEALKGWVDAKSWRCLPINIFCGDWAVAYFVENVGNRKYLPPDTEDERQALLLYDELLVARTYIGDDGATSFATVVRTLNPALSLDWKWLYRAGKRTELRAQALDILSQEHGKYGIHYDDFID